MCFSYLITSEIEIDAPLALVWEVLADLPKYEAWNPFTPRVEGELVEGGALLATVRMGTQTLQVHEICKALVPNGEMVWHPTEWYDRFGISKGMRSQRLEARSGGTVAYLQTERLFGPLSPISYVFFGAKIKDGLDATASALKARCERQLVDAIEDR